MKKRNIIIISIVTAVILIVSVITLPFLSFIHVLDVILSNISNYELKEVDDFIVQFYDDHCYVIGTTEKGNLKKTLVVPSFIDNKKVEAISGEVPYRIYQTVYNKPSIQSEKLERIYIGNDVKFDYDIFYKNDEKCNTPNLKKVIVNYTISSFLKKEEIFYLMPRFDATGNVVEDGFIHNYPNVYYVTNNEKDHFTVSSVDDIEAGQKIENIPENPTKEGFVFDGWYKDDTLKTKWNFELDKITSKEGDMKKTENQTRLFAKWI